MKRPTLPALDRLLPVYQFFEQHHVTVRAAHQDVFNAVEEMDLVDSTVARTLMTLWRILARLILDEVPDRPMSVRDFLQLVREPPNELVRGLIGGTAARKHPSRVSAETFLFFDEPGCIKLVWGFYLLAQMNGDVSLLTETRVQCTDSKTLRWFRLYWWVIRPWSGLIRKRLLASIKVRAEQYSKV